MARQLGGASGAGDELLDVVVIGGSQAGLAMAWHLARQHLRFVVLEAASPAAPPPGSPPPGPRLRRPHAG